MPDLIREYFIKLNELKSLCAILFIFKVGDCSLLVWGVHLMAVAFLKFMIKKNKYADN